MFRVFLAVGAILAQGEFFRRVNFIPVAQIILAFAHRADERKEYSLVFFGHTG